MEHVTPKQLARAIQVSESSVKRWCDQGVISTVRTAGGHRRIAFCEVVRFLRESKYQLVRPEVLGLPVTIGRSARVRTRVAEPLRESLLAGRDESARCLILDLYLAGHELSSILDDVVAEAFHEIGALWQCGSAAVYQERQACEVCLRVLHEIRGMLPQFEHPLRLAIGGTPEDDRYQVANAMVDLVLRNCGWNTITLGSGLPFETLRAALQQHRPRLFWLSVSHVPDADRFVQEYQRLCDAAPVSTAFVVGGRALTESIRERIRYASYCDKLKHLEAFARSLEGFASEPLRASVG